LLLLLLHQRQHALNHRLCEHSVVAMRLLQLSYPAAAAAAAAAVEDCD
jgi:hypothetical protein